MIESTPNTAAGINSFVSTAGDSHLISPDDSTFHFICFPMEAGCTHAHTHARTNFAEKTLSPWRLVVRRERGDQLFSSL